MSNFKLHVANASTSLLLRRRKRKKKEKPKLLMHLVAEDNTANTANTGENNMSKKTPKKSIVSSINLNEDAPRSQDALEEQSVKVVDDTLNASVKHMVMRHCT